VLGNALGSPRFLAVYLGAGVGGAAVSFALTHPILSVGASGALGASSGGAGRSSSSVWVLVATILLLDLGMGAVTPHLDRAGAPWRASGRAGLGGAARRRLPTAAVAGGGRPRRAGVPVGALATAGTATLTPSGAFPSCPTELL
jgi:hypothetical protein